jgi:hypothetical protein
VTPIPWILIILKDIPFAASGPKRFLKYHKEQVAARKKVTPYPPPLSQFPNWTFTKPSTRPTRPISSAG